MDNWLESFQLGNIWGLGRRGKKYWEALSQDDVILFYVKRPIAGVVGYGVVKNKFHQTKPLWSAEKSSGEVMWPWCFEFNIEFCLSPDQWNSGRISNEIIRFKAGIPFRAIDKNLAEEIIAKLKPISEVEQSSTHSEIKQMLVEIGKLQNYIAEEEYPFELGRLDVVWRRVAQSVPTFVFEVNIKGDFYHDLAKLKHAYDLWNSHIFIVSEIVNEKKVKDLLSGSFHEISNRLKFVDIESVRELYRRKRAYIELERELGIFLK